MVKFLLLSKRYPNGANDSNILTTTPSVYTERLHEGNACLYDYRIQVQVLAATDQKKQTTTKKIALVVKALQLP